MINLKSLYTIYNNHPEGKWIMIESNVLKLYDIIRHNPIKKILDLGTGIGCTAAVMALALEEKEVKDYEIHTVEQFQKCIDIAKKITPPELQKHIKFYQSDGTAWTTDQIPYQYFSVYKELPEGDWDLILTDGPGGYQGGNHFMDLTSGDTLKLHVEDKIKPGTLLTWDGRFKALRVFDRYIGHSYFMVDPNGEINTLERKDNPNNVIDSRLKTMQEYDYIKKDAVKPSVENNG